jgi:RHS repeat-associated protein
MHSQGNGATRKILWRFEGDVFGTAQATNPTSTVLTMPIRMPCQYFDSEVGTSYNYFRDYDASTGRYVESDPIGLGGGMNTYGYVGESPINFIDPLGLDATKGWNTSGGRSILDWPTNGNWGGKCWSGGQYACNGRPDGNLPPTDSGDRCYMNHDKCYDKCNNQLAADQHDAKGFEMCNSLCDSDLVHSLRDLPSDPKKWPNPPRPGTEGDSSSYLHGALRLFGR